ncbi:MAG: ATP-binding protein [Ardenticatenia bacterium]|nr:ATP-binding protein [Ardenticatenia bacterium]
MAERVERLRPLAEEKQITVVQRIPHEIVLPLDRERFGQVVTNLLDNAVKFTPAGGRVTVEATQHQGQVRLVVRDTGPGIPPEALPHIFERFYQLDRARTRDTRRGTGLGLAIAKHLVLAHGGRIWAQSAPGQGAAFFVELPAD